MWGQHAGTHSALHQSCLCQWQVLAQVPAPELLWCVGGCQAIHITVTHCDCALSQLKAQWQQGRNNKHAANNDRFRKTAVKQMSCFAEKPVEWRNFTPGWNIRELQWWCQTSVTNTVSHGRSWQEVGTLADMLTGLAMGMLSWSADMPAGDAQLICWQAWQRCSEQTALETQDLLVWARKPKHDCSSYYAWQTHVMQGTDTG